MNKSKVLMMLGLCRKAGCVVIGTPMVTKALQGAKIKVAFYSADASQNTRKKITDKCAFYGVRCEMLDISGDELSHALGKTGILSSVGITNENFANELLNLVNSKETR